LTTERKRESSVKKTNILPFLEIGSYFNLFVTFCLTPNKSTLAKLISDSGLYHLVSITVTSFVFISCPIIFILQVVVIFNNWRKFDVKNKLRHGLAFASTLAVVGVMLWGVLSGIRIGLSHFK
jgi:hypothetical protein